MWNEPPPMPLASTDNDVRQRIFQMMCLIGGILSCCVIAPGDVVEGLPRAISVGVFIFGAGFIGVYLASRRWQVYPYSLAALLVLGLLNYAWFFNLSLIHICTSHCRELCPEVMEHSPAIIEDAWSAKATEILAAKPELVVAASPYRAESLAEILKAGVRVLALSPHSLEDVYTDIRTLAALVDRSAAGERIVRSMTDEISQTREQTANFVPQRVYCEEWGKPLIASQLWVAELVRAAGGIVIGEPGVQISAEAVAEADPDVILAAWCGAGNRVPLGKLLERPGWAATKAAQMCIRDRCRTATVSQLL